jgi:hypothetical protein
MPPKGDTATPLSDAERVTNLTVKGDKSDRKGGRRCHPNRINRHEPSLIGVPRVRARNTTHERAALPSHQQIVDAFNAEEGLRKLARVDVVNDKRKRDVAAFARFAADRVAKRAADRGDVEPPSADETLRWVRLYFAKAGRDDFLAGRANGGPGHESWRPTFDFLIAQRTWPRVIEAPSGDGGAHAPIAEFQ